MSSVVFGVVLLLFGAIQLMYANRLHAYFAKRNEGRSQWKQNPRGWSVGMVRFLGIAALVAGLFLVAFGVSQLTE